MKLFDFFKKNKRPSENTGKEKITVKDGVTSMRCFGRHMGAINCLSEKAGFDNGATFTQANYLANRMNIKIHMPKESKIVEALYDLGKEKQQNEKKLNIVEEKLEFDFQLGKEEAKRVYEEDERWERLLYVEI